jgi:hypothetical protein
MERSAIRGLDPAQVEPRVTLCFTRAYAEGGGKAARP